MAKQSIHKDLEQVRKPRVHIKYEVHVGDAKELKELPFVVGVLGDFSGNPTAPLRSLGNRRFIEIDRDNFNEIMAKMTPGLNIRVPNTLKNDGTDMSVQLKFESMEDFEPAEVARQVEPLRNLLQTRDKLKDLLTRVDRSEVLEKLLEQILTNEEQLKQLSTMLGKDAPAKSE
jgi:type VI secretion system protein ImpB